MSEDLSRKRTYEYKQNSNLVLNPERDRRRRKDEGTGEVESLAGRMMYSMGDRVAHSRAVEVQAVLKKFREKAAQQKEQKRLRDEKNGADTTGLIFVVGG